MAWAPRHPLPGCYQPAPGPRRAQSTGFSPVLEPAPKPRSQDVGPGDTDGATGRGRLHTPHGGEVDLGAPGPGDTRAALIAAGERAQNGVTTGQLLKGSAQTRHVARRPRRGEGPRGWEAGRVSKGRARQRPGTGHTAERQATRVAVDGRTRDEQRRSHTRALRRRRGPLEPGRPHPWSGAAPHCWAKPGTECGDGPRRSPARPAVATLASHPPPPAPRLLLLPSHPLRPAGHLRAPGHGVSGQSHVLPTWRAGSRGDGQMPGNPTPAA